MDNYLQSIRQSSISILDGGRAWTGGIFQYIGSEHRLSKAVINQSIDAEGLKDNVLSTLFSGGTSAALVSTLILAILLTLFSMFSCCCQKYCCKKVGNKPKKMMDNVNEKFQLPVIQVSTLTVPVHLRHLFGIVLIILLILTLVPLFLAFSANSKMHEHMTEPHGVVGELDKAVSGAKKFLDDLQAQIQSELKPFINYTLLVINQTKQQVHQFYLSEFHKVIGADQIINNGSELFDRIQLFYDAGKDLNITKNKIVSIQKSINSHKPYDASVICTNPAVSADLCNKYKQFVSVYKQSINKFNSSKNAIISQLTNNNSLDKHMIDLGNDKIPEQAKNLIKQLFKLDKEFDEVFSKFLSKVFDGLSGKISSPEIPEMILNKSQPKLSLAKEMLLNISATVSSPLSENLSTFDGYRFMVNRIVLFILLFVIVYITAASAIVILLPQTASKRQCPIVCGIYSSYIIYAIGLLFVFVLFAITSMMQTYACRYLMENPAEGRITKVDEYLIPEANAIIKAMKLKAKSNPNATDMIPLTGVGKLLDGIKDGCSKDLPIVKALDSVRFIELGSLLGPFADKFKLPEEFSSRVNEIPDMIINKLYNADLKAFIKNSLPAKLTELKNLVAIKSIDAAVEISKLKLELDKFEDANRNAIAATDELMKFNKDVMKLINNKADRNSVNRSASHLSTLLKDLKSFEKLSADYRKRLPNLNANRHIIPVINAVINSANNLTKFLDNNKRPSLASAIETFVISAAKDLLKKPILIINKIVKKIAAEAAKCRGVYDAYTAAVGIPCKSLLYPLSIIWFCIGWCICSSILFSLFAQLTVFWFGQKVKKSKSKNKG